MDKKVRSQRRSPSSSSSSSSSTSSSSSSSSSSSYDSRRGTGNSHARGSTGRSVPKREINRISRKYHSSKQISNTSTSDRSKTKKAKSSSLNSRKSKSGSRKGGFSASCKDYDRSFSSHKSTRSPSHHHKRSSLSKKLLSPTSNRKSRKPPSPVGTLHKRGHKKSLSSTDRLEYHANKQVEQSFAREPSLGKPRDPRIDDRLKRTPEHPVRDKYGSRDSPRRYDYPDRRDKRSPIVRLKEVERKEVPRHPTRDFEHHERATFDDRRQDVRRDDKDKKHIVDVYKERDDRRGRYQEREYSTRDAELPRNNRDYEHDQEFYTRKPETSPQEPPPIDRNVESGYERYGERNRYEGARNRYEDDRRPVIAEFSEDNRRRNENRFIEDRRKVGSGLERPLSNWEYPNQRKGGGEWPERNSTVQQQWPKPKKRRTEWTEEYGSTEWREGSDWTQDNRAPADKQWPQSRSNRYYEGSDWSGPPISIQDRLGTRTPMLPPQHQRRIRKDESQDRIITDKTSPMIVIETPPPRSEPEVGLYTSPAKRPESSLVEPIKEAIEVPITSIEKDNFSDFSDDADDLLNQEVIEQSNIVANELHAEDLKPAEMATYEELLEEEDRMDLEEISDDEFEEEKQAKFSVSGALDINWSALMSESTSAITTPSAAGSALKKFRPLHLLTRLGVSTKYARPHILDAVSNACRQIETDKDNAEDVPEILPVVAAGGVVKCLNQRAKERFRLFNHGPSRRALCAREDLALRRKLCIGNNRGMGPPSIPFDRQLFKEAVHLLQAH